MGKHAEAGAVRPGTLRSAPARPVAAVRVSIERGGGNGLAEAMKSCEAGGTSGCALRTAASFSFLGAGGLCRQPATVRSRRRGREQRIRSDATFFHETP
jgi:hypothetical protein